MVGNRVQVMRLHDLDEELALALRELFASASRVPCSYPAIIRSQSSRLDVERIVRLALDETKFFFS